MSTITIRAWNVRTPLLAFSILFLGTFGCSQDETFPSREVRFSWAVSEDARVVGYRLYWGDVSKKYTKNLYIDGRLTDGATLQVPQSVQYFNITACDKSGMESGFTTEINPPFTEGGSVKGRNRRRLPSQTNDLSNLSTR